MGTARGSQDREPAAVRGAPYLPSALTDIASDWGYGGEVSCAADQAHAQDDTPLATGFIATQKLSSGLNVCASDLTTVHDNERIGLARKSLTIALHLDGSPISYEIDEDQTISLAAGGAVALSASDEIRMVSRFRRGEQSRIVVIQACPDILADADLADHLEAQLGETSARPLVLSGRARGLAQDLFSPEHTGLVGRLLAESCALELLAHALKAQSGRDEVTTSSLHPRDVARIHRVRDKLLANLDAEHHLCDLARDVGTSASALKYKFTTVIGEPVFQFLRNKRLDRARNGLMHESWTVSQAAYYVGYRHATNFATAFRRRFGVAPTSSRRSVRATVRQQAAE